MNRGLALAIAFVAGCYKPASLATCTVACGANGECPGSMTCDTSSAMCTSGGSCMVPMMPDAPPVFDSSSDQICFGHYLTVCVPNQMWGQIQLPQTLDTGTGLCNVMLSLSTGQMACVVVGQDIALDSTQTQVSGPNPLVLLAIDSITIAGQIDVSSHVAGQPGPGAIGAPGCGVTVIPSMGDGGPGGSFGARGGTGGVFGAGGSAAQPGATVNPNTLQPGCPGGDGRNDAGNGSGGLGGLGGGALAIIAGGTLSAVGTIQAGGAGGGGGASQSSDGGGGGGAGGMIVIDAMVVNGAGLQVLAEGGGGGGGACCGATGNPGNDGNDGLISNASGGNGSSLGGGNGGAGSQGGTGVNGVNGDNRGTNTTDGGGGGGGGGAGVIWWYRYGMSTHGTVSPTPAKQ